MKKINFKFPEQVFGIESSLLKLFWIPAVLIAVFLLSLRIVILPKIDEIYSINNQISSQNNKTKIVKDKINYLLSVDKNELNKDADYLNSALLQEKNSYVLVNIVKRIADQYGYRISSFSVTPGELKGGENVKTTQDIVSKIPADFVVIGPKEKYLDFILTLEKSLPILQIDKFDLRSGEDLTEMDLTVSVYYIQKQNENSVANLSLADLTLKKDESDVLKTISQFQKVPGLSAVSQNEIQNNFVKYTRENPFSF
jgi:cell division protein FtsL